MAGLRILVVGSGGREHALAWKIAQSGLVGKIFAAPGNPGIAEVAECFPVKADDIDGLVGLADEVDADLVVVGPEVPLSLGLVDRLNERGRKAFGPCKSCARLEASKVFSKEVMMKAGVPTAKAKVFDSPEDAIDELSSIFGPVVVKLDGLAAGKGVVVAETPEEAAVAVMRLSKMQKGGRIILEEKLVGHETSLLCICDGQRAVPLMPAKDYKRALDNDKGPNTGGMGCVAPSPFMGMERARELTELTVVPILRELASRGTSYRGVLYAGLMLTDEGPKVLEYNCRFGDPETEAVLPLMEDDLVEMMLEASEGRLNRDSVKFADGAAVTVIMTSKGYPDIFDKGFGIGLPEGAELEDGVVIFHAGTALASSGKLVTAGGRVLAVTATGIDVKDATDKAYRAVEAVDCPNLFYRKDIGVRGKA
ncbi:MAG TPA: phosphoribosylamine--glycine ligase [Bacillota bacterium]|nr:phosphoribosylamine--glycine ligase [Bacillota bacterium]HOG52576.1 phosphoribosylamine--glycine ligase [Bacillota bacterium]